MRHFNRSTAIRASSGKVEDQAFDYKELASHNHTYLLLVIKAVGVHCDRPQNCLFTEHELNFSIHTHHFLRYEVCSPSTPAPGGEHSWQECIYHRWQARIPSFFHSYRRISFPQGWKAW